jgi:hypothetical protein
MPNGRMVATEKRYAWRAYFSTGAKRAGYKGKPDGRQKWRRGDFAGWSEGVWVAGPSCG